MVGQVNPEPVEAVRDCRAGRTACRVVGSEHEVIDEELRAPSEEVRQRGASLVGLETTAHGALVTTRRGYRSLSSLSPRSLLLASHCGPSSMARPVSNSPTRPRSVARPDIRSMLTSLEEVWPSCSAANATFRWLMSKPTMSSVLMPSRPTVFNCPALGGTWMARTSPPPGAESASRPESMS